MLQRVLQWYSVEILRIYPELGDHRDYDRLARELMERIWALKPEE